ncbi:MAG: Tox-REase-5 domain-containing protein [Paracoccaceae bacterium]
MGAVGLVDDALKGLWTYFRGKPDLVIPRRVPLPTRPRADPDTDPPPLPPLPPIRPHPRVPRLRDPDEESVPTPEEQTEGETTTTTEDMQECETCPECEPRKQGHAQFRKLTGTEVSKINGATYQNWVIPWFRWIGNEQEEWRFSGVWYGGIDPSACQLIETKAKFGSFFRNPGSIRVEAYDFARIGPLQGFKDDFVRQYGKTSPYTPFATIHWVMHTYMLYMYMSPCIQGYSIYATAEHRPYPGWNVNE